MMRKRRWDLIGALCALVCAHPATAAETGYRIVGSLKGPDSRWDYLAVDAGRRRLYMGREGGIAAVDLDSGKVTDTLVAAKVVHGVAVVGKTGQVVAADVEGQSLMVVDGATGRVRARVKVGEEPDSVVYDPSTKHAVSLNEGGKSASVVDLARLKVVATIPIGGQPETAVADGAGLLYDNVRDKNEIAVISLRRQRVVRRLSLPGCVEPTGLAFDREGGLLVSACGNGVVKIVRARDGADLATLHVGEGPDAVLFDTHRRMIFVPSGHSGTLSVIALRQDGFARVVQTLTTKRGVRIGAVDPSTGQLYLPSADFAPMKPGAEYPEVIPGTVRILIVSPN